MRVISLPFVVLLTASASHALSLHRRDAPRVLEAPIERRQTAGTLAKRGSSYLNVPITNNQDSSYLLNLTLGTPAQTFTLALDTGSSDLWVISASSSVNAQDTYNSGASSTFQSLDTGYNATYADGTQALGIYATDTLVLGNATVKDFEFVVVNDTTSNMGIAGIGYNISTYSAEEENKVYNNLPYALTSSGITASTAYSLFLNSATSSTGTILFGGVNKAKYVGDLQTVPVVPVYNAYYSLAIALTEITVTQGSSSTQMTTNLPLAVSLDSGSTLTSLPQALVDDIYTTVNATFDKEANFAYVECTMLNNTDTNVTYSFSGATVSVALSDLVIYETAKGFPEGTCAFGIVPSVPGVNILGDNFLRSAYVVYDLDNNEISLANANYGDANDDILEIGSGKNAVPGATMVANPVSSATGNGVAATATGATMITVTGSTATAAASGTSSSSSGMAALPTGNANHLLSGLAGAGLLLLI